MIIMTKDGSVPGSVALITGGSRGIGLETARQLGQRGFTVVLGARNQEKGEQAAQTLRSEGLKAESVQLGVADADDRRAVHDYFARRHKKLDVLINNAAVWLESPSASDATPNRTSTISWKVLQQTFDINFFGPVLLTQLMLPLIRAAPAGRIVNVSSIHASLTLHSDPTSVVYHHKPFAYAASKSALNAFTVQLAHELRETPIKVNSAHPGWVRTQMGGQSALLDTVQGSWTSVHLATLPPDGPTGGYFFLEESLPW